MLSPISALVFQEASCLQISPPKLYMHLSRLPYVPRVPPIPFSLIWSPEECLMRLTDHKAAHYVVLSSPVYLLCTSLSTMSSGTLSSRLIVPLYACIYRNSGTCGYSLQCVRAVTGSIRCQSHGGKLIDLSHVYGTWALILREERRLRVLRRIFGPRRDEVTGEWRKLHNE